MLLFISILLIGIFNQDCYGVHHEDWKVSVNDIPIGLKSVVCSGGKSSCPANETCCELESGQYGCCPVRDGICCNDHLHCCPNGYTCDIEHSRCQKVMVESRGVLCPSGDMSCANGETCCQTQTGDYTCCSISDGVCCKDSGHCCPHGYMCKDEENKCEKYGVSIPWLTKRKATPVEIPSKLILPPLTSSFPKAVQCPDQKSYCSEDTTCCESTSGSYGCCPYRQASCCSDKMHCCDQGFSCDQSGSKCVRHLSLIPLSIFEEQTCPDGITKCSTTSTCCPTKINDKTTYSCCPYARGVCCGSNGSFCCPYKSTCDEEHTTCQLNKTFLPENQTFNKRGSVKMSTSTQCKSFGDCDDFEECCSDGKCCAKGKCKTTSGGCYE